MNNGHVQGQLSGSGEDEEAGIGEAAAGVVVLGPGRSGTSGISRAFVHAGFFAGAAEEMLGPRRGNPLGHFEPLPVLEANEELLGQLDCAWWAATPPRDKQLAISVEAEPRLRAILSSMIGSSGGAPIVVKEPRINSLLPLWGPILDGLLHPVLAIRDPLEVAMSHSSRDETSASHALAAWEVQTTMILEWLHGRTATLVPYARITADPQLAVKLVTEAAQHVDAGRTAQLRPEEAAGAIRPDLRHEGKEELDVDEFLTGRQAALREYLMSLLPGDVQLTVPEPLRRPNLAAQMSVKREDERVKLANAHADAATYLRRGREWTEELEARLSDAHAQAETLNRSLVERDRDARALEAGLEGANAAVRGLTDAIQSIQQSASWRLTKPLRAAKRLSNKRH